MLRIGARSVGLVLSLGMAFGINAIGTTAAWTDSVPVTGTTASTAGVDLKVNTLDNSSSYAALNASNMAPGGSTAAVLTVKNNGTVPLNYYVDAAATNADGKGLAAALIVHVTGAASTTGSPPSETCGGTTLANTGTSFGPGLVGSAGSTRLLAAGASETLCVEADLPSTAPTTLQTASTNISFSFPATTPATSAWTDSVAFSGTTLTTATITAPVLTCGASNQVHVTLNWTARSGATGYRVYSGTGGANVKDVSPGTTTEDIRTVSSGTMWVQTLYGSAAWTSSSSNTRTYNYDGTSGGSTCN